MARAQCSGPISQIDFVICSGLMLCQAGMVLEASALTGDRLTSHPFLSSVLVAIGIRLTIR